MSAEMRMLAFLAGVDFGHLWRRGFPVGSSSRAQCFCDRAEDHPQPSTTRRKWNLQFKDESILKIPEINLGDTAKVRQLQARGVPIIHHHDYVSDLPANHPFPMRKFHGVMKFLRRDQIVSMKQVVRPDLLSESTATWVHTSEYIDKFYNGKTTKEEQRKTGFRWNERLVQRCRLESGGTLLGAKIAIQSAGLACSTAGGTHHAYPTHGAAFCLLNDLAITAKYVLEKNLARKVLIVDLDVHQGDGTAFIFNDDDRVFTFSMHGKNSFPLRKARSDLDLSLANGTEDSQYMELLQGHLQEVMDTFRPDLILFDAGVDPHVNDELGKLSLTDEGLYKRDYFVIDQAVSRGIPCVTVIGGGYSRDVDSLSLRHTIVHRAATKIWQERGL